MEVKTITSEKGLKFLVHPCGDLVYVGMEHHISWVGQVHVNIALKEILGLESAEKNLELRGVDSKAFFLGDHSLEEVEEALRNYPNMA